MRLVVVLAVGVAFPALCGIGLLVIASRSGRRSRRRFRQALVQAAVLESLACGLLSAVLLSTHYSQTHSSLLLVVGLAAAVVVLVCSLVLIIHELLAQHFANQYRREEPRQ